MAKKINVINSSSTKFLPKKKISELVDLVFSDFKKKIDSINIVYLDNQEIKEINTQFLNHNYPTDVISFTLEDKPLIGEIYIGVEIAKEQSKEYNVSLRNELSRLAVHGSLHLCGYNDKTAEEKMQMTNMENKYV
jgi:rRNA maturation RNase YbeY